MEPAARAVGPASGSFVPVIVRLLVIVPDRIDFEQDYEQEHEGPS
jgi:hypothetical protein